MKEGPSRPAVRCRSQATASCCRQERWWCCVKKARERHAVREMKEDPSEPSCRGGLQTAMSGFGQKAAVVNVMVKRRDIDHVRYGRERRAQANLCRRIETLQMTSKPGLHRRPGSQVPCESPDESHASYTPDTAWPGRRFPPHSSRSSDAKL